MLSGDESKDGKMTEESFRQVNVAVQSLSMINQLGIVDSSEIKECDEIKDVPPISEMVKEIDNAIHEKLQIWQQKALDRIDSTYQFASCLLQLEMAKKLIPKYKHRAAKCINHSINVFKRNKNTGTDELKKSLEYSDAVWGKSLMKSNDTFSVYFL